MAGLHDLDLHFDSALHHRVEVIHFEPEQHTIAVGSVGTIANAAVVMFDFKAVQLQNERSILYQLLILPAPVGTSATQQALIPPAAGFDIRDTNERLRAHGFHPNRTSLPTNRVRTRELPSLYSLWLAIRFATATFAAILRDRYGVPLSPRYFTVALQSPLVQLSCDHRPVLN